jgi:hypothetical protein
LAILKYWQNFLKLQTLKLNNENRKKIFVLRRKKFGRIDNWFSKNQSKKGVSIFLLMKTTIPEAHGIIKSKVELEEYNATHMNEIYVESFKPIPIKIHA